MKNFLGMFGGTENTKSSPKKIIVSLQTLDELQLNQGNFPKELLLKLGANPEDIREFAHTHKIAYKGVLDLHQKHGDVFDIPLRYATELMWKIKLLQKNKAIKEYIDTHSLEIKKLYWQSVIVEDNCYMDGYEEHERSPHEQKHHALHKTIIVLVDIAEKNLIDADQEMLSIIRENDTFTTDNSHLQNSFDSVDKLIEKQIFDIHQQKLSSLIARLKEKQVYSKTKLAPLSSKEKMFLKIIESNQDYLNDNSLMDVGLQTLLSKKGKELCSKLQSIHPLIKELVQQQIADVNKQTIRSLTEKNLLHIDRTTFTCLSTTNLMDIDPQMLRSLKDYIALYRLKGMHALFDNQLMKSLEYLLNQQEASTYIPELVTGLIEGLDSEILHYCEQATKNEVTRRTLILKNILLAIKHRVETFMMANMNMSSQEYYTLLEEHHNYFYSTEKGLRGLQTYAYYHAQIRGKEKKDKMITAGIDDELFNSLLTDSHFEIDDNDSRSGSESPRFPRGYGSTNSPERRDLRRRPSVSFGYNPTLTPSPADSPRLPDNSSPQQLLRKRSRGTMRARAASVGGARPIIPRLSDSEKTPDNSPQLRRRGSGFMIVSSSSPQRPSIPEEPESSPELNQEVLGSEQYPGGFAEDPDTHTSVTEEDADTSPATDLSTTSPRF